MLIDDGLLRFEDGSWRPVEDLANVTVPPTIQLLLAARLDRLDAEERGVMERGSVEGKVFHAGAVTTLSPEAQRPTVRPRLLALARKELIRPDRAEFAGEDAFRFRHLLIRDAAYQAMPKEQRADLHERFAALARTHGRRSPPRVRGDPRVPPRAGISLPGRARPAGRAGASDRAGRGGPAALVGRSRGGAGRLRDRAGVARAMRRDSPRAPRGPTRSRCSPRALSELNDFPAAMRTAIEAAAAAKGAGEEQYALRAELVRIDARAHVDPSYPSAMTRQDAESVLRRLEEIGDEDGVFRALLAVGRLDFYEGHCMKSLAVSQRLLRTRTRKAVSGPGRRGGRVRQRRLLRSAPRGRVVGARRARPGARRREHRRHAAWDRSVRGCSRCRVSPRTPEPRWRAHATSGLSSATRAS